MADKKEDKTDWQKGATPAPKKGAEWNPPVPPMKKWPWESPKK